MTSGSDLIFKIALSHIQGIGDTTAKDQISYLGSAELVFKENKKSSVTNINKKTLNFVNSEQAKNLLQMDFKDILLSLTSKMYKRKM